MAVVSLPIDGLRRAMCGPVLGPEDPGYDVARMTFNALTDRRPAVIACCARSDDVAAAIEFAGRAGLPARFAAVVTAWRVIQSVRTAL